MKLKSKILIPIASLIIVSMLVSTFISYYSFENTISRLSQEQMADKILSIHTRLSDRLDQLTAETKKLSEFSDIQKATKYKGLRDKASTFLADYLEGKPYLANVSITDTTGMVMASSHDEMIETQPFKEDTDFFQPALEGGLSISRPQAGLNPQTPVFSIAVPVLLNKSITGVLAATIDIKVLGDQIIKPVRMGKEGITYLAGKKGLVLHHPDNQLVMDLDITGLEHGRQMQQQKNGFIQYTLEGDEKIASFSTLERTGWIIVLEASVDELILPAKKTRNIQLVIGLATILLLSIGILFIIQLMVIRPIGIVDNNLKEIARGEGDLTRRLDIKTKDEIGQLAFWFNSFIQKLESIIIDIKDNAMTVDKSSGQLTQLSKTMSDSAGEMKRNAGELAGDAGEVSENINSVAAAVEQASTNISMVSAAAEELNASISHIAESSERGRSVTDKAVSNASQAAGRISELEDATKQITRVTEVISEISDQTNLLALNATIEAARAGEAGKGFAVVASEIKDLATQTAKATEDIRSRVTAIQASSTRSIDDIKTVSDIITDVQSIVTGIATAVEQQSTTTRDISDNIVQASAGLSEVNENIAQTSSSAEGIAKRVADVSTASVTISENSSKVNEGAKTLSGLSEKLADLISGFTVSRS